MTRRRPVDLVAVKRELAALRELVKNNPQLTSPGAQARLGAWLDDEEERGMVKQQSGIRLDPEDVKRLDKLVEQIPIGTRSSIARMALRLGLDLLEQDPARAFNSAASAKSGKRSKKS